jgi:DNA-binding transcriptional LysR family regulator
MLAQDENGRRFAERANQVMLAIVEARRIVAEAGLGGDLINIRCPACNGRLAVQIRRGRGGLVTQGKCSSRPDCLSWIE